MLRVMFITDLCDLEREQTPGPERSAERVTEVVGTHTAIWRRPPRNRWACSETQRRCALIALLLCCALPFVGCVREQQPSPEIVAEINALEQRTIAPDCSLQNAARIRKHPASVQADWQIRSSGTTEQYFEWVKQQLGADYHVVSQTKSVLTMGKTLPGDSYTLEFKSTSLGSTIDVRFLATSD
jgi:hypothetical protein